MRTPRLLSIENHPNGVVIRLASHVLKLDLVFELYDVLSSLRAPRIVISGTNGYFAAGADINELKSLDGPRAFEYAKIGQALTNVIDHHAAVTVAAIDGYCMGGGLDVALACDLRYATPGSILAHPGGRIGIMTGWGGTQRLPQIVGRTRALEMMVAGRRLNAADAHDWGLISGVVDDPIEHGLSV